MILYDIFSAKIVYTTRINIDFLAQLRQIHYAIENELRLIESKQTRILAS